MRALGLLAGSLLLAGCSGAMPSASPSDQSTAGSDELVSPSSTSIASAAATIEPLSDTPGPAPAPPTSPEDQTPAPTSTPTPSPSPTSSARADVCVVTNESTKVVYGDLNAAINAAEGGSTLTVQGTCTRQGSPAGRNAAFIINRSLTLQGVRTTDSGEPTLDGESLAGVVWVDRNVTVTIADLTITNGNAERGNGGGLFNDGGVVTLRDAVVSDNRAWVVGGVQNNFGGIMVLRNTTVNGNLAHAGGGGVYNAGEMTITESTVSDNTSETNAGGGIFNFSSKTYPKSGTLAIVDSTIEGNRAAQSGGGIFNAGSEVGVAYVSISGSTIRNNESGDSGGGVMSAGQMEFLGPTTIGGNVATRGGGMFVWAGLAVGSCPTALGGMVTYEPRNTPTDYDGVGCVDQENVAANRSVELRPTSQYAAQTFTARTSGALTSVTLRLEHTGLYSQTAFVRIESVDGGLPTGVVLAQAVPTSVPSTEWLTFGFASTTQLIKGTEYAIVLIAPTPPWQYSDLDPYAAGHAVVNGNIQAADDFAFMTWVAP